HVLPIEEMPGVIIKYIRHPYVNGTLEPPLITDVQPDYFKSILTLLRARTGHNFDFYKKTTLARRMQRRMGLLHIEEVAQYLNFLRQNSNEVSALFKDLFISVTDFFRDAEAWEALEKDVIKPLCAKKDANSPIRVWVPGCASGEEVYSLAMLFLEELQRSEKNCKVQIFASDIDPAALEVARKAV
ncbi:MAG TPA: CheR family methyltransferase, partial [Burkholderiales bacterium]|nr:CheR family methyltransferase [Burkholderiales bacterium]